MKHGLFKALAAAGIVAFAAMPPAAARPIELKLAFFTSDRSLSYAAAVKPFIDAVNAEAKGTIEIVLHSGGVLGREIAQQILKNAPGMRVLYMSGYTDDAVLRHGVLTEETFFLQKPFSRDGLVSKVRQALDSGTAKGSEEAVAASYFNQKSGEPTCKES